jgi:hypothetical protein
MEVKISKASNYVEKYIKAGLVPYLWGSPAIGKSDIVKAIAEKYKLKLIDIRLSQCDTTDLLGMVKVSGSKAEYVPFNTFPLESDPIPEGYNGWCLFMDEMNSAPRSIQAASYKIILDRMVGQHKLHKNVAIVCAGNQATDNAIVEEMSTALQSRMCHIEVVADLNDWLEWAYTNNIDYRITSYLQFKPSNLYSFSPDHSDKTYASPRTWYFANKILGVAEEVDYLPMLTGAISEGVAREFVSFMKVEKDLPTIEQLLANPVLIKVPEEPSALFALTGAIAHYATKTNIEQLMLFVNRLPMEFQVVCLKEAIRRNAAILQTPAVNQWISTNSNELF